MPQLSANTPLQAPTVPSSRAAGIQTIAAPSRRGDSAPSQANWQGQGLLDAGANALSLSALRFLLPGREARLKQLAELANVTHSPKRNLRAWKTVPAGMPK